MGKLIKLKYGKDNNIKINNYADPQNVSIYDFKDQQITRSLELLKTFLDLYYFHKKKNTLNYQINLNILKHLDIEIIRLKDNDNIIISQENLSNVANKTTNINSSNNIIDKNINKNMIYIL